MKSKSLFCKAGLALLAAHSAFASAQSVARDIELNEVLVEGSRDGVDALRRAMIEAEDRFFSSYNDLNQIDEFDIVCRYEALTGTRLRKRYCRGVYEERAVQDEAHEAFKIRQFVHSFGGFPPLMPASPPVPAGAAVAARRSAFQENLREVLQENEELVLLLRERSAAMERYEQARRRVGGAKADGGAESGLDDPEDNR